MTLDEIPEMPYRRKGEPDSPRLRERYWNTAFGLQKVDGLEPSGYAKSLARDNIEGSLSLDEVGALLEKRYRSGADSAGKEDEMRQPCGEERGQREADLVSRRVVELLEEGSFALDPSMLKIVHKRLFQDLDEATFHPGAYKTEQLVKPEVVLNGDSVFYAPPSMYDGMLNALFSREASYRYGYEFDTSDCANFSAFIARIWQVHPFYEGNTRTVAVFAELYLADLGFTVGNDAFERHAAYFRDALVRANYRNRAVRVDFDETYLQRFFMNAVQGTPMSFDRSELMCRELFEHPDALRNINASDAREVRDYLAKVGAKKPPEGARR